MSEDSPLIRQLADKLDLIRRQLADSQPMTMDQMENMLAGALRDSRDLVEALRHTPEARLQESLPRESRYGNRRIIRQSLLPLALTPGASSSVHRLKISLHGAKAPTWRRIEFPSAMTLDVLHQVIQAAFGWQGLHAHSFQTMCGEFGNPDDPNPAVAMGDESAVALAQVADSRKIIYMYGSRPEWRHELHVEGIGQAEPGVAYPRCLKGRGAAPGEGAVGLEEWNRESIARGWSPTDPFDLDQVTQAIAHLAAIRPD